MSLIVCATVNRAKSDSSEDFLCSLVETLDFPSLFTRNNEGSQGFKFRLLQIDSTAVVYKTLGLLVFPQSHCHYVHDMPQVCSI